MPNDILVLMTDQHRADWIGAFGADHVRTPSLDGLASEGAIFTQCMSSSPLCMPARASFLTGMYPHNFGMWDNIGRVHDVRGTYLYALRGVGYRTCHVGKSHLYPHGRKDLRNEEPYMHALGWDDILECTGPLSTQNTQSILTDWMEDCGTYETFLADYRKRREVGMNKALWPSPLPDGKHMDDFIARTAVDYIVDSEVPQPLYLFVGLGGPHNPWDPPERFDTFSAENMPDPLPRDPAPEWLNGAALEHHQRMMGHNRDITPEDWARVRSLYSARVEHVDYCMGQVLEAWWATRGKDSWVLFWSDHGEMLGDKARCSKSVFYEASVRVPVILRPPAGQVEAVACDGLVSLPDLTATLLDIGGCESVSPNVFGQSLSRVFQDPEAVGRSIAFSEVGERTMVFDGRWKLVLNSRNEVLKLFDISEDPNESVNLAGRPDTAEVVGGLRGELLNFLLRTAHRQFREVNS